ncbi:MAG: polysaccharide deacetylase family protein [Saprospiraceae bacterium]|nr:polysaccharide deacetylase family protein [Saprospiraceae bacterium]
MRYFSLLLFLSLFFHISVRGQNGSRELVNSTYQYGGLVRLDSTKKSIYLTFTGGDFGEGTMDVCRTLKKYQIPANFFFTGDFYRNNNNRKAIKKLMKDGHYLGPHSDKHLLYASWEDRDLLLVTKDSFRSDLLANFQIMNDRGIKSEGIRFFMPPYEWYNDSISYWSRELGLQLINFTAGTRSNADYTTTDMGKRYVPSEMIMQSIFDYEAKDPHGLNGFILLLHVGAGPGRVDKFYTYLPRLIKDLKRLGYQFALLNDNKGNLTTGLRNK